MYGQNKAHLMRNSHEYYIFSIIETSYSRVNSSKENVQELIFKHTCKNCELGILFHHANRRMA